MILPMLEGFPITQISGAAGRHQHAMASYKTMFFDEWLRRNMPTAKHVLAERSGHAVFYTEPELVVGEIRSMVQHIRGR